MGSSESTAFWWMLLMLQTNELVASGGSVTLTANITLSDPRGVCPLKAPGPVEFICDVTDTTLLTWKRNSQTIRIFSSSFKPTEQLMATSLNGIQVQLVSIMSSVNNSQVNLTSRLIVDTFILMSEDRISCVSSSQRLSKEDCLIYIVRAPPPAVSVVPNISKEAGNSVKITLQWDNAFTETHSVDEYCVIAPAGSVCQSETTCLTPDTDYECSGLVAGNQYGFVVYAKNCGNQSGINTTFIIAPHVPVHPSMCSSVPVYDQFTNRLIAIQNTWTPAPSPRTEITNGVSQDVLWYNLLFESSGSMNSRGSKNISAVDVCTAERCTFDLSTSFFGSHYTLSVAAENVAGLGEHLTCTPDHISTSNNMMLVTANVTVSEHATVECQLLTLLPDTPSCKVCYGVIPNCDNLTCLPSVPTNGEGRATVTLPQLEDGIKYCYTAAAIVDADIDGDEELAVAVQGSFSTACDKKDLIIYHQNPVHVHVCAKDTINKSTDMVTDPRCGPDSIGSLPLPNGVVCYSGTTLGSTASYICNGDYQVPGYSDCKNQCNLRTCQGDGHWSGETLPCLKEQSSSCSVGISLCFIFTLGIGAIATLIVTILVRKYTLKQQLTKVDDPHPRPPTNHETESELPNYLEYGEDNKDLDETNG